VRWLSWGEGRVMAGVGAWRGGVGWEVVAWEVVGRGAWERAGQGVM
jgi:hypothetical protein